MTEDHDRYLELAAGYALGALDGEDRLLFEEHLGAGCDECEAALADYSGAAVMLAASAPAAAPSPELRARVIKAALAARPVATPLSSAVKPLRPGRPRGWIEWSPAWAAIAAAMAIVAAAGWVASGRLSKEVSALKGQLGEARDRIALLESQSVQQDYWTKVLTSPQAKVAVLARTPDAQTTLEGRAIYDPGTHAAVVILRNVFVPTGQDYQLWAIRGSTPASLGLVHPDKDGIAILRVDDAGDPASLGAFAVSLEQQGGSPNPAAPTGPVVMLGKLGG
ncbi:MAG TPA: anti-sigma factor [Candidatus Eisenbacteria bacterium]|nr:anti-sigma factor [Candidatus Eisenbacteria bacterium]